MLKNKLDFFKTRVNSLRSRALIGGSLWAVMSIVMGGYLLFTFFNDASQRRFDDALGADHLQVVVALSNSAGDPELITSYVSNPAFERPYSGSYWQAYGPDDVLLTSRSLFDAVLQDGEGVTTDPSYWEGDGPAEQVRGIHQIVELGDGSTWVVSVAKSLTGLRAEQQQIRQNLFSTLGIIGVLGVVLSLTLTSIILRPLAKLREDVTHRWDEKSALEPSDYPDEVAPLVSDINVLLDRNREVVNRARRQAADMAHALNTPSAILRNELEILGMEGANVTQAQEALARIDSQLHRSLARIRAANSGAGLAKHVDLGHSIDRVSRLFRSMHEDKGKYLSTFVQEGLKVPMDVQDLEEILGNMLENAFKYCENQVHISAKANDDDAFFTIEDDGPGIPEKDHLEALREGGRLDTSKPGTGLGLAIVSDLVQAYGGSMELENSWDLGGLRATFTIPMRPITPGQTKADQGKSDDTKLAAE